MLATFAAKLIWILKMAWRDAKGSSSKLFVFALPMCLGVAVIVGGGSLRQAFDDQISDQARLLLGADAVLTSKAPFPPELEDLVREQNIKQMRELRFRGMAQFQDAEPRLVSIRAIEAGFPFDGSLLEGGNLKLSDSRKALVEKALYNTNGNIKLGTLSLEMQAIDYVPGSSGREAILSPTVFIPYRLAYETELVKEGSLVDYVLHLSLPEQLKDKLPENISKLATEKGMRISTVSKRADFLGRVADNLHDYFALFGISILVVAALGTSAALSFYLQSKQKSAAILRCLGVEGRTVTLIFLTQVFFAGILAGNVGVLLGFGVYLLAQLALQKFLAVSFSSALQLQPIILGNSLSCLLILALAAPALHSLSLVSPINALREKTYFGLSKFKGLVWGLAAILMIFFAILSGVSLRTASAYTFGLAVLLVLFIGSAALLRRIALRSLTLFRQFPIRHALRNIYRPKNQTLELTLVLGISTLLASLVFIAEKIVTNQIAVATAADRPNVFIFDVQSDQLEPVEELLKAQQLPILKKEPIVLMRLSAINAVPVARIDLNSEGAPEAWTLRHLYWATYRDHLVNNEKLASGTFTTSVVPQTSPVPISIDSRLAQNLKVKLGDSLQFSLQGITIDTVLTSMRDINWQQLERNSMLVFPLGSLELAPQYSFMATKANSEELPVFRKSLASAHPNISLIDLNSILLKIDKVYASIRTILESLAFTMAITTLLVIAATIISSREDRAQELGVLRTLGTTRRQIVMTTAYEYGLVACFSALIAFLLCLVAGTILSKLVFDLEFAGVGKILLVCITSACIQAIVAIMLSLHLQRKSPARIIGS